MTTPRDDPRPAPPSRPGTSLRFAVWFTAALLTAAGGWVALGAHGTATGSSTAAAAPTSFATPSLLPVPTPHTTSPLPHTAPLSPKKSATKSPSPRRAPATSAPRDEFAGPASDAQLQQLMNASYPGQYTGPDRPAAVKAAWAYEAKDLAAGGYSHTHLQATAMIGAQPDRGTPATLVVLLMWSGTYPVTGWVERQLVTIRTARHVGGWAASA